MTAEEEEDAEARRYGLFTDAEIEALLIGGIAREIIAEKVPEAQVRAAQREARKVVKRLDRDQRRQTVALVVGERFSYGGDQRKPIRAFIEKVLDLPIQRGDITFYPRGTPGSGRRPVFHIIERGNSTHLAVVRVRFRGKTKQSGLECFCSSQAWGTRCPCTHLAKVNAAFPEFVRVPERSEGRPGRG